MSDNHRFTVLFVCSGNSCRSPMAEAIMRMKLPRDIEDEVHVVSAGTLGIEGMPAADHALSVVDEMGGDLSRHRSKGLSRELVQNADLILAMAQEHVDHIHLNYAGYRENVYLLRRFAKSAPAPDDDIDDPIGYGMQVYRNCAQLIDEEIDRILPTVTKLVQAHRNHHET